MTYSDSERGLTSSGRHSKLPSRLQLIGTVSKCLALTANFATSHAYRPCLLTMGQHPSTPPNRDSRFPLSLILPRGPLTNLHTGSRNLEQPFDFIHQDSHAWKYTQQTRASPRATC
ncbi:hypothetical protein E4T56_gene12868 [Termitomyces sp. T112]|nr:hypothetical protein E4T56_gene12868 [Termitomyces sp. T112]